MLGYVGRTGRRFLLRPKVLAIGTGYLSAINAEVVLQPFLQEVVNEAGRQRVGDRAGRAGHRLHRARITEPRHPADGRRRLALPGVPDVDGPRAARLSARRPSIDAYFERVDVAAVHRAHRDRPSARCGKILKDVRIEGLRRHPGRARLRHRVGGAADLRPDGRHRRCRQLLGRDQPARPRHDDQEAAAGAAAGGAPDRRDADAASRADATRSSRSPPTSCACRRWRASASRPLVLRQGRRAGTAARRSSAR